jgi:hypothetical protein
MVNGELSDDHAAVEEYVRNIVAEARERVGAACDAEGMAHDDPRRAECIERAAATAELNARCAIARFRGSEQLLH